MNMREKEELKEKQDNEKEIGNAIGFIKVLGKIAYVILYVILILILVAVILQRVSNNQIGLGGLKMYNIVTGSMVPVYNVGDVIIAKGVDANSLKVGDDVVYKGEEGSFKDRVVTHRIINIQETGNGKVITTQGVANNAADPSISQEQILGKVVYKLKILSLLSHFVNNNLFTMYFVIFLPIVLIIVINIVRIKRSNKDEEDEDDDTDNDEQDENDEEQDEKDDDNKR